MKGLKKYMAGILVAGMVLGSAAVPAPVYATEAEDAQEDNGDYVEITLDDKPYLALGADLTADQQHTVLSYMGIEAADFDKYDVVYVSNAEEHQYLDSYVPKKQIGTKALSSGGHVQERTCHCRGGRCQCDCCGTVSAFRDGSTGRNV